MHDLTNALWVELRKATRSRMPLFTALGFLVLACGLAFFMFIYKYPTFARSVGLISTKANLAGGTATWPYYLGILSQATAIGGLLLFSLVESWVFGREFADGTLKDLLAVPVARATLLLAKFLVVILWSLLLTLMLFLVSLLLGAAIGLSQGTAEVFWHGAATVAVATCLVIVDVFPFAFFASVGRGYLLPMGVVLLVLVLGNVVTISGWGTSFPWAIPALYAGLTAKGGLEAASYLLVLLTGLAGMAGTYLWWKYADQNR
ncbi:MAG TPA: ABC transporter permease [Ktedonobacteraceae bacterium]|nr:ABC transporter permease [Ktedonobacteraceae bacterium]